MSKIIFELVVEDIGLTSRIEQARQQIRNLNKEIRQNPGPERFNELVGELSKTRRELSELTKEQRKLNKELEALKLPKDSIAAMRIEYGKLSRQIAELSAQERNSPFGQGLIKNAARIKKEIDGVEQSIGRFTGNVGNYKSAFIGIGDAISGGLVTGGVAAGTLAAISLFQKGVTAAAEYGTALSRLSSITGVTGKELEGLKNRAQELTTIKIGNSEIVNTAQDIFEAFTLVGSARPELLKDADALKEVTRQSIVLSKASGDDLATSVEAATTTLGQFQLGAGETGRIINELAAGSKEGASEITDTTAALKAFGTTASNNNITTTESIALIETLADRQLKGAEAGTQLRNILAKLAGADIIPKQGLEQLRQAGVNISVLKDNTIPLGERLKELSKIQGNTAALTKVFGLENLSAAQIITDGLPKYEALLTNITGTAEATKQAAINADNLQTKLDNLEKKGVNILTSAFLNLEPTVSGAVDVFSALPKLFEPILLDIQELTTEILKLASNFGVLNDDASPTAAIIEGIGTALDITTAPLRLIVNTITFLIEGVNKLIDLFPFLKDGLSAINDVAQGVIGVFGKLIDTTKTFSNTGAITFDPFNPTETEADAKQVQKSMFEVLGVGKKTAHELTEKEKAEIEKRNKEREAAQAKKEREADQEARSVEAQEKRISEIKKAIRDLNLQDETGFDAKLQAIENKRADALAKNAERLSALQDRIRQETGLSVTGTSGADVIRQVPNAKPADVTEAELIDEETKALGASFNRQRDELKTQREKTAADQEAQLKSLLLEVAQIAAQNDQSLAQEGLNAVQQSEQEKTAAIKREFEARNLVQLEKLKNGEISRRQFDQQEQADKIEQANRLLAVEKQYAADVVAASDALRDAKIKAADAALQAQLDAIEKQRKADVEALQKQGTENGIDTTAGVAGINAKAAEDAKAAQIDYAETVKTTTQDATNAQLSAIDSVNAAQQGAHDTELARIEAEKQARQQLRDAALQTGSQIASGLLQIQGNRIKAETQQEVDALEESYKTKIDAAKGNADLQAKLEKELADKRDKLQKEAAEKQKRLAIVQAVIDTALAVIKALGSAPPPFNFALAALSAAAGAIQIALIKSQPVAEGGFTKKKKGQLSYPKHIYDRLPDLAGIGGFVGPGIGYRDETGHRVAAKSTASNSVFHGGEYVATAEQVAKYPDLFSRLDMERRRVSRAFAGGGFTLPKLHNFVQMHSLATGGFAPPQIGLPNAQQLQAQTVQVQAQATFSPDQTAQIGNIIAAEIAKQIQPALANGLGDANRRLEREQSLEQQRTV